MRETIPARVALLDSAAHPLIFGGLRGERFQISVLDDDLIRVQHFPHGTPRLDRTWMIAGTDGDVPAEGRRRDDLTPYPCPAFVLDAGETSIRLRTGRLQLDVTLGDFALRWSDDKGREFASDLPQRAYPYDRALHTLWHYLRRREGEHYYGFGERSGPLDKAGQRIEMRNLDAIGYSARSGDPLYKHIPFYITFVPDLQIAYGLLYDNLATTVFDMGREIDGYHGPYRYYRAEDGDLDYTLIYGPDIPGVIEKYARLTGYPMLPPRWSLGYLGSTMSYTEAPDAQEQLKRFVELCREHEIPCDLFHLSSGYTTGDDGKRYVFNWNTSRVPDPHAMSLTFHEAGIHLAANIKPCLLTTHPRYDEVKALGGFVRAAESDEPAPNIFWGGQGSHLDFTNPAAYAWWKAGVREALLEYGIDATWNDNNEYEIWDDEVRCAGHGEEKPIGLLRPVQTLLMVRASHEAQREFRPEERPFVLTRSACPGMQRYAQTWSGDNFTSWESLRYNIPMGLGLSLSGMPNTGHDVGGFAGPRPDPELFVRWVQNGIFHPRFCIHSWNSDNTANEPWMYPDVLPLVREWIEFRYRLIPYLYTLLYEAAQTGHPIIRPLVYAYPGDERCHTESFDFMLGPNLLVASVLDPGAHTREVYLPQGTEWHDFYTGQAYSGGKVVEAATPLHHIPLFAPAGGMIPLGKVMRHVGEQTDDLRQVFVFPLDDGQSQFTLIEDDGVSLGYQRGEVTEVVLSATASADGLVLSCRASGGYMLPYHEVEFILPPGDTRPVRGGEAEIDARGRQHHRVRVE